MSDFLRNRLKLALRGETYASELLAMLYGTTGEVFYVHSGTGNASWNGRSPSRPVSTWAGAVALCTANQGDLIVLMPGHNENIGNAQIDLDVAGVTHVGLGHGAARPRFDFDHASASINVAASSNVVKNIALLPSVTDVLIGIDIETTITDTLLEDIEILPGEDGVDVDEFALGIDLKVGCSRTVIKRFKERQLASAAGTLAGIRLTGASDDVIIEDADIAIFGAGVVAPINGLTTLSTNLRIIRGTLVTDAEPGIEVVTQTTGVIDGTRIFTDLATIDACTVADLMAHFDVKYVEVGNEAGTLVKTESVDD